MFDDTYKTIITQGEGMYKDKGSKFLAFAYPVQTEEQVKEYLEEVKKKWFDARHHCYAYTLGPTRDAFRINDDGEPSGTAGKPIYGQILSKDLTNILIVVVRYFGGVKLGVRGLIDAYKTAAQMAIENCQIKEMVISEVYEICFPYMLMNDVMRIMKENNLEQLVHDFKESCRLEFSVRKMEAERIKKVFEKYHNIKITYKHTI